MGPNLSRRRFAHLAGAALAGASLGSGRSASADVGGGGESLPGAEAPLRLHFNENPYGPSPAARRELARIGDVAWQYPAGLAGELRATIARRDGVPEDHVLLGNGSAEILQLVARAALGPGRALVVADPTYEALEQYAAALDAPVVRVPLDAAWGHDVPRMVAIAKERGAGLLYLCNPNNPTGTITPTDRMRRAVGRAPEGCTVVVDEAYHHYVSAAGYATLLPSARERAGLVVVRTFSKIYGLAGLRLGYAVTRPETVARLAALQSRNNLNVAALRAAAASLEDPDWVELSRTRNAEVRDRTRAALAERGFATLPSETNFFMIDLGRDAGEVGAAMRAEGIRVGRPFPPLTRHLRVTVGRPEAMERFLEAFDRVIGGSSAES